MKADYAAAPAGDALTCSCCRQEVDLLVRLPLSGHVKGWRRWIGVGGEQLWVGLCERCLRGFVRGFKRARAKAATLEASADKSRPPTGPDRQRLPS